MRLDAERLEALKAEWTDQFVRADASRPELARFGQRVGRVVTVNWSGQALVDFQDGAWYDLDPAHLIVVGSEEGKKAYDPKSNSAQPRPDRQA